MGHVHRRVSERRGRDAHLTLERAAEGRLGAVADRRGDLREARVRRAEALGGELHAPLRQVLNRRHTDEEREPLGDLFRTVARHVPPPAGVPSPFVWGKESGLTGLFGPSARLVHAERRDFVFRYESPAHFIDLFRTYYGPTYMAFRALDEVGQKQLEADLTGVLLKHDRGGSRGLIVAGEYLQAVLERR